MTQPGSTCPEDWKETLIDSKRACTRSRGGSWTCDHAKFKAPVHYDAVCGRIKLYFRGKPKAFKNYLDYKQFFTIDYPYMDGVSLSRVENGQKSHVWTFTAGINTKNQKSRCPPSDSDGTHFPEFIKNDYNLTEFYCNELPIPQNSTFWQSPQCNNNSDNNNYCKYFTKQWENAVTGNLEARICLRHNNNKYFGQDIAIEQFELYVSPKLLF